MKLSLFFFLFFFSFTLYSQDELQWTYLGDSDDGKEIYMRFESSEFSSKEAWIKMINPSVTKKNKYGKLVKVAGGSSIGLWEVNCSDKTYIISNRIIYNNKGEVVYKYNDSHHVRVIPDGLAPYKSDF